MKTALHDRHCALGAKMVPFAGWDMPLQYQSMIQEHLAVRERVGIFDVSHMGRVLVQGNQAEEFLDAISTNRIAGKVDGSATYTVWCNRSGGSIDDALIYKEDANHFFVIVNASNRDTDLLHLQTEAKNYDVKIIPCYTNEGILAVQGPLAQSIVEPLFPEVSSLNPMHFFRGNEVYVARTGYTGEDGFEIYAANHLIVSLWDKFLAAGAVPVGLGARDTLRLEMGYALYGHEISLEIAPNESVAAWTIKWQKPHFLGKDALTAIENSTSKRSEYGLILNEQAIARAGYPVWFEGKTVGTITSGAFSPTLQKPIAIALVSGSLQIGATVEVEIRNRHIAAQVVALPFVHTSKRGHHEVHRIP